MIVLILFIPFAAADITGNVVIEYDIDDPVDACMEKSKESSEFADALDNDIIGALESIASIAFVISTTMNAIEEFLTTVDMLIGVGEGCCALPYPICKANGVKFEAWEEFYSKFQTLSGFVSCGWCSGGGVPGLGGVPMDEITLGAIPAIMEPSVKGIPSPERGGIGQFHISPFDNIYVAFGCLCPVAILFNMRKLKTIYSTYNCCVQESCTAGLSTEECDHFLSTSTCMYWEGSMYKMLVNVAMSFIAKWLGEQIPRNWLDPFKPDGVTPNPIGRMVNCVLLAFRIVQLPDLIDQVKGAFDWMSTSFNEPTCSDLGFDKIEPTKKDIEEATDKALEDVTDPTDYYKIAMPVIRVEGEDNIGYFITKRKEQLIKEGILSGPEGITADRVFDLPEQKGAFVATANDDEIIRYVMKKYPDTSLEIDLRNGKALGFMTTLNVKDLNRILSEFDFKDMDNAFRFALSKYNIKSAEDVTEFLNAEMKSVNHELTDAQLTEKRDVLFKYIDEKGGIKDPVNYLTYALQGVSYSTYKTMQDQTSLVGLSQSELNAVFKNTAALEKINSDLEIVIANQYKLKRQGDLSSADLMIVRINELTAQQKNLQQILNLAVFKNIPPVEEWTNPGANPLGLFLKLQTQLSKDSLLIKKPLDPADLFGKYKPQER